MRAHLVVGGFPPGASAAHDMDFARLRLLEALAGQAISATVAGDFADLLRWLPQSRLLVTYTAGPHLAAEQIEGCGRWLEQGGRWLALHGSSGGRAERLAEAGSRRRMVKLPHHELLGCFFLNHPPVCRFRVDVPNREHPITRGLPASFETEDELYFIKLLDSRARILLTTELAKDPLPGFGFAYDRDTSLLPDGRTRALGYVRDLGKGAIAYLALGHCHSPTTNGQPFVDESVAPDRKTPPTFRGSWETPEFQTLLTNAIGWAKGA